MPRPASLPGRAACNETLCRKCRRSQPSPSPRRHIRDHHGRHDQEGNKSVRIDQISSAAPWFHLPRRRPLRAMRTNAFTRSSSVETT